MHAYIRKGTLKYTPDDTGEPFYIYDLGTYHVAIEANSIGHEIVSLFKKRYLLLEEISKALPYRPSLIAEALYKLEGAGILALGNGRTDKSAIYSLLKKLSFGPGAPTDSEVFSFVNTFWKKDGLYQDSYIRLSDIANSIPLPGEDVRNEIFTLIQNGNIICYDFGPRYPKERYSSVDTMPFLVYTEKGNSINVRKIFKKEVSNVS